MKKAPGDETMSDKMTDELLPEYKFDYNQGRSNRFAEKIAKDSLVVLLEPDVAEVFKTPEAVNKILRALIDTMPPPLAK